MSRSAGNIFIVLLIFLATVGAFFLFPRQTLAGASQNISGWAWSESIGWISFNNTSGGGAQNYGVNLNTATGELSGYAWSENIGWISFDRAVAGPPPLPPYNGGESYLAKMDLGSFQITGWARAIVGCTNNLWDGTKCTGSGSGDASSGWDGWIKFSGTAQDGSPYGVTVNKKNGLLYGYAWGGEAIGWISFNCANTGTCGAVNYQGNSPYAPLAYWKLDDSVTGGNKIIADLSGNAHTGTTDWGANASGMDCTVSGKVKGACLFDGVDDYISTAPIQTPQDISIEAWIMLNTVSLSGPVAIADQRNGTVVDWELWFLAQSNEFRFGIGGISFGTALPFTVASNVWYHIAVVKQGSVGRIYVNGVEYGSGSGIGAITNTGTAHAIGALSQGLGEFFPGIIDDVVLYGYGRTAAQILSDYQSVSFPALYFPFEDNVSGNGKQIADASGNENNGATHWGANFSGMDCSGVVNGRYGLGCQFDGVDDYIDGPVASFINQTQESWIKLTAIPVDGRITSRSSCGNGRLYIINGKVKWEFGDASSCQSIQSATTLQTGAWYHIAATNNNGALAIYINGVLDNTGNYTLSPIISSAITIGSFGGTATFFPGVIDELRLYSYPRTASQILADKENMIAYWQFNEGAGGVAEDQAFYRNDGAILNAAWVTDAVLGSNLLFNGTSASLRVPDNSSLDITKELTVSAWVKRANSGTYDIILSKPSDNATTYQNSVYQLYISDLSDFALWRIYKSVTGGQDTLLTSATKILPNQWYFIVGTYKFLTDQTSEMNLYVNGVQEAVSTTARGPIETSAVDLSIGAHTTKGQFFDGSLEDVRMYTRALTATDVSSLYFEHALRAPQTVINPPGAGFNTANTIIFNWDQALDEANSYFIYAWQPPAGANNFAGISNATSFILKETNNINGAALVFAPFALNTPYTVKVSAHDVQNRKLDSLFSIPATAATSAGIPVPQTPAATPQTITWNWTSGGGESGYFVQIKEDAAINSGWIPNTQLSWLATGLSCGVNYTLQVKARNSDNDETAFAESVGTTSACTGLCVNAFDCQSGEICLDSSGVHSCAADTQCLPSAVWCNKLYRGLARDGLCTAATSPTPNKCNLPPQAGILVKTAGSLSAPFQFTGENSDDDYTPLTNLQAQWDFGDGATIPYGTKFTLDAVSHQYGANGTYTVKLKVKDADGAQSLLAIKTISLAGAATKIISIAPRAFPATNADYSYNFGSINSSESKAIAVAVCNMGTYPLAIFSIAATPPGSKFSVSGLTVFNLQPQSGGTPSECTVNNDPLSWKQITVLFNPANADGAFIGTLTIASDADTALPAVSLTGQASTPVILPTDPVEKVIYDGRILINPPPGFVEFLENLRFVEPAKP